VLILDYDPSRKFSRIYRYECADQVDQLSTKAILGLIEEEQQSGFTLIGYDLAFVPEHDDVGKKVQGRLYVVAADGNQSIAFHLCRRDKKIELQPVPEYLPMRLFGGKGLVAAETGAYYDFADSWIPLVQQRRPRYVTEATLETPHFDGREPDCVWHRLLIDACIPPETSVQVWTRATNEERDLATAQWQLEPRLYLRGDGSELPFMRSVSNSMSGGTRDGEGTWELLFQPARGRFLQLRLRLSGNERSTPRLRSLRAYYPRFSYLVNYLPGVYREDEQSASFLDRFLANRQPEPAPRLSAPPSSAQSASGAVGNGGSATPAGAGSQSATDGHKAADFVSEDDVRRAIQKGEKIYVSAKTIITPSARDIGEPAEVFAKA